MVTNKTLDSFFNYGATVLIKDDAPIRYKPCSRGSICGIRVINNTEIAKSFEQSIGSELYLIEFCDGETLEIPKRFLLPFK